VNAYSTTTRDMAAALLGTPRAKQKVSRVVSSFNLPHPTRHIVLVTPDGQAQGEYYEVSDRGFELLKSGTSPEDLGLEPAETDSFEESA